MTDEAGRPERREARRRAEDRPGPLYARQSAGTMWVGECGHIWDRRVDDTEHCPRCSMQTLFDLQWKRTREADTLWQEAHPGNLVWPDLGELIGWLLEGEALLATFRARPSATTEMLDAADRHFNVGGAYAKARGR